MLYYAVSKNYYLGTCFSCFNLADRISVLVYGEIIASAPPSEIRGDPKVREAYLGDEALPEEVV